MCCAQNWWLTGLAVLEIFLLFCFIWRDYEDYVKNNKLSKTGKIAYLLEGEVAVQEML